MAVTVESTTTSAFSSGSTSFSQNRPTGTTDGDLLVAIVFTGNDNGTTDLTVSSAPSGWTLVEQTKTTISGGSNNPVNVYTYEKIASSEPSSWTWTLSTSGSQYYYAGSVFRISESSGITASDEDTVDNNDSPSFTTGLTPTGANNLFIMATVATDISSGGHSTSSYAITTDNPTWTELLDTQSDTTGTTILASVAYATRSESTSTGNWSCAFSTSSGFADSASQLHSITTELDVTTNLDTAGSITIDQGGSHDVFLGITTPLDSPGVMTITGDAGTPTTQEYEEWTDQSKSSSNWTNQSK